MVWGDVVEGGNGGIGGGFCSTNFGEFPTSNPVSTGTDHEKRHRSIVWNDTGFTIYNPPPPSNSPPPPPAPHLTPRTPSSSIACPSFLKLHPPPHHLHPLPPLQPRITTVSGRLFSVWVPVTGVAHVPDSVSYARQGIYSNDVRSSGIIYCLLTTHENSS